MSFLVVLTALALEYYRPLPPYLRSYGWFLRYAGHLEHIFNAGQRRHGLLAWLLAVMPLVFLISLMDRFLHAFMPLLAVVWGCLVLYLLLNFRHAGIHAGNIAAALRRQDVAAARRQLEQWRGQACGSHSPAEVARLTIEEVLRDSYRYLFAILIWFVFFGPGGAVLYQISRLLDEKWGRMDEQESGDFGHFAATIFSWLDWVPQRLTAISFAVAGNFEDAMYCWRSQARQWAQHGGLGVVLASGAGAMGVKLGEAISSQEGSEFRSELGLGDEADADYLDSAVSMVTRTLVLWLILFLLLNLARWAGN